MTPSRDERDALVRRCQQYLQQLAPHVVVREGAQLISNMKEFLVRQHLAEDLTAQPSAGEPVAWSIWRPLGGAIQFTDNEKDAVNLMSRADLVVTPLYTHPAPSESSPETVVVPRILAEVLRARDKHPAWPTDVLHAAAIVSEESGELMRAAVQHRGEGGTMDACDTEATQTAATCIRFLERK